MLLLSRSFFSCLFARGSLRPFTSLLLRSGRQPIVTDWIAVSILTRAIVFDEVEECLVLKMSREDPIRLIRDWHPQGLHFEVPCNLFRDSRNGWRVIRYDPISAGLCLYHAGDVGIF